MTRDELVDVLFGWDGGLGRKSWSEVQAALDEYTREVRAAALREAADRLDALAQGGTAFNAAANVVRRQIEKEADR